MTPADTTAARNALGKRLKQLIYNLITPLAATEKQDLVEILKVLTSEDALRPNQPAQD